MGDFILAGAGARRLIKAAPRRRALAVNLITAAVRARQAVHKENLVVMSGMAEGFDEMLAETALSLGVRLWAAVPNRSYGRFYWGLHHSVTGRNRTGEFESLRLRAWKCTYVMEEIHGTHLPHLHDRSANLWRNDFMAQTADDFLVWQPSSRGTGHCVRAIRVAEKWRDDMVLFPRQETAA